ncbi:MAG TPA: hypothetical protein VLM79_19175, partial [Kofleriaceae bacterium]|nr:hypothetical protein [Kofleriaceae bacterium]
APLPSWLADQAPASMRSPGVASPINAPRIAIDPRAPIDQREIETSRRVPLGWESTPPPRRRTPWFVGGSILGASGIVLAVALTRGAPGEPSRSDKLDESRVVMTSVEPAPVPTAPTAPTATAEPPPSAAGTNAGGSDDPLVVIESASDAAAMHRATEPTAPSDNTDDASASKRAATRDTTQRGRKDAKSGDSRTGDARIGNARTADARIGGARTGDAKSADVRTGDTKSADARIANARTGDAKSGDAKVGDARTGDAKSGDAKSGDAKSGDAKATKPVARPLKVTGMTANEISELYSSVGRELSALPGPAAQDLWSRLLLIKIQELMAAPQAKRDEAARQLQLIHQEAVLRKP